MREDRSSDTALGVTTIRAVHQLIDELPHLLEDPVSLLLLGEDAVRQIREMPQQHQSTASRALRSHVVLRSRYAEDELLRAARSGIGQFINLGAGYDTFSCRQPGWARTLTIVEVDHPATQSAKIELIKEKGIETPGNVEFVPLDLESGDLLESLARTSLNLALPTFVACLGVLAYLRPETVSKTFMSIAGMAKGSEFVFAFAPHQADTRRGTREFVTTAEKAAAHGEPWLTRFEVEDLNLELAKSGFATVSFLDPTEAEERYYKGRRDLPAPGRTRICRAAV